MSAPITDAYRAALAAGSHEADAAQAAAVDALAALQLRLIASDHRTLRRVVAAALRAVTGRTPRHARVPGLYLWGSVGRGKTWLMDLFFSTLPVHAKRRVHFHRFMRDVHRELARLGEVRDPLARVADRVAHSTRVLCFDELFVSDIGDAMILGTLLTHLFERGVTLVATSNLPPHELYRDGLQRARFLPAIAAIQHNTNVHEVGGAVDFRLRALERASLYRHPAGSAADAALAEDFSRIAGVAGEHDCVLQVEGRPIRAVRCADGIAWFTFAALCEGPRGAADYIELAHDHHTLLVSDIPQLTSQHDDQARRFVTLVDECYDRRVKLILSAATPLLDLYTGERLRFEFQRTTSRLQEMQTHEYLGEAHLG